MTKIQVLNTVKELPDEFSIDILLDRLLLLHKVEVAQEQIKEGKTISHEAAKNGIVSTPSA